MNTTYDAIFTSLIYNAGIPQEKIDVLTIFNKYEMIHNATHHYINKMEDINTLTYDDTTETLNTKLDSSNLLILTYCMKIVYLQNELEEYESVWSVFRKEVGLKFYGDQIKARERAIEKAENKVIELISNIENKDIMS